MMRSIFSVLTIVMLIWGCCAVAADTHYQLRVDGLACPFCEYNIEKNLIKMEGVKKAKVNLKDGTVVILVADGYSVSEEQLRKVITDAGFTLKSVESHTPGKT